jgi:hypothetical protein
VVKGRNDLNREPGRFVQAFDFEIPLSVVKNDGGDWMGKAGDWGSRPAFGLAMSLDSSNLHGRNSYVSQDKKNRRYWRPLRRPRGCARAPPASGGKVPVDT